MLPAIMSNTQPELKKDKVNKQKKKGKHFPPPPPKKKSETNP